MYEEETLFQQEKQNNKKIKVNPVTTKPKIEVKISNRDAKKTKIPLQPKKIDKKKKRNPQKILDRKKHLTKQIKIDNILI